MITKKLAVPLINDKILSQAQHVYVATAGISDAGFDFIRSRIPANCKISMVTSLHGLTSPNVLRRILKHYQGRITFNIFRRNVLHANLFIFDLPYRKSVAFVGSGTLSIEGIKDHEELFWKITDPKEIESLLSWYTSYFEFGMALTESLVQHYEIDYPVLRRNEIFARKKSEQAIILSNLDFTTVKFKNQFFKKEDFDDAIARKDESSSLDEKLTSLSAKAQEVYRGPILSKKRIDAVWDNIGGRWIQHRDDTMPFSVDWGLLGRNFTIRVILPGNASNQQYRQNFLWKLEDKTFAKELLDSAKAMGEYLLEVNGTDRPISSFQNEQFLSEFIHTDYGSHFDISVSTSIDAADPRLSIEKIATTIGDEMKKLAPFLEVILTVQR